MNETLLRRPKATRPERRASLTGFRICGKSQIQFTKNGRSRRSGRFFPLQDSSRQCGGLLSLGPFDMEPFDIEPLDMELFDIEPDELGFFFTDFGFVLF
ncbi:MAG TPA: hypothetical protein VHX61_06375 [Rhizomicrobium sp.]|nr:hypothetical protein [Rhizomicrobium sp.]